MDDNCPICGAPSELCICYVGGEEHGGDVVEITVTPESCCYDPDLRDLLHRELAAHGIELDIPHVDFCTTVGMVLSRMLDDRRIVYQRLGEMQQHANEQLQIIRDLRAAADSPVAPHCVRSETSGDTPQPGEAERLLDNILGLDGPDSYDSHTLRTAIRALESENAKMRNEFGEAKLQRDLAWNERDVVINQLAKVQAENARLREQIASGTSGDWSYNEEADLITYNGLGILEFDAGRIDPREIRRLVSTANKAAQLRQQLATARNDALEEAAGYMDECYHGLAMASGDVMGRDSKLSFAASEFIEAARNLRAMKEQRNGR